MINQISLTMATFALSVGILNVNPSYAAKIEYDLKFFDDSGNQLGSGGFSYDSNTTFCAPANDPSSCAYLEYIPIETLIENGEATASEGKLISFDAKIQGHEWVYDLGEKADIWWDTEFNIPRQISHNKVSGLYGYLENFWSFGDRYGYEDGIVLYIWSDGSWRQSLNFYPDPPQDGGTWTATKKPVPEPLTFLGAGIALGFGGFFRRELSKKKQKKISPTDLT
ncbi:PEP-CTERM sorting domain-containing protein [Crocosphaera sp. UHCC 0190]|uniref:PEP-CTERM sorting domain-containing protein n=1 Tax=Crocosphaera sp. UHCC 0190 TaxID=3110246 RepID=UPI002B21DC13|nr:PEP-CTERM sorting domain-containing protein [Crocosphaera sp. UHCC 0190]MEA5510779.1 PEP-CTERM sorting domain-containing protein [Crocosphaera sp. UHCC 0190]